MKSTKGQKRGLKHESASRRKPESALNGLEAFDNDEEEMGLPLVQVQDDDDLAPESSLEDEALLDISEASDSDEDEDEGDAWIGRRKCFNNIGVNIALLQFSNRFLSACSG